MSDSLTLYERNVGARLAMHEKLRAADTPIGELLVGALVFAMGEPRDRFLSALLSHPNLNPSHIDDVIAMAADSERPDFFDPLAENPAVPLWFLTDVGWLERLSSRALQRMARSATLTVAWFHPLWRAISAIESEDIKRDARRCFCVARAGDVGRTLFNRWNSYDAWNRSMETVGVEVDPEGRPESWLLEQLQRIARGEPHETQPEEDVYTMVCKQLPKVPP